LVELNIGNAICICFFGVGRGGIQRNWVSASLDTWLSLLYLGVVANGLGYWVWAKMLARYQVSRVAPFTLGVPVVGMVAGVIILGESVSAMQWLGATLIMSALFFIVAESRSVIKRV
jgi:O-acetylserine/cysteine efflux transporter